MDTNEAAEEWRASNLGNVRSVRPWVRGHRDPRILKPWMAGEYPAVTLYGDNGAETKKAVHQLVCVAFKGEAPSAEHEVAHGDGNPMNTQADNLRWATGEDNNADKKRHGTHLVGSQTNSAKLTEDQVGELMRLAGSGVGDEEIAAKFGVTSGTVSAIRTGQSWSWLTDGQPKVYKSRKGEKHPGAKLTAEQVLEIRAYSGVPHAVIAAKYGISKITVSQITCRRIWKHI